MAEAPLERIELSRSRALSAARFLQEARTPMLLRSSPSFAPGHVQPTSTPRGAPGRTPKSPVRRRRHPRGGRSRADVPFERRLDARSLRRRLPNDARGNARLRALATADRPRDIRRGRALDSPCTSGSPRRNGDRANRSRPTRQGRPGAILRPRSSTSDANSLVASVPALSEMRSAPLAVPMRWVPPPKVAPTRRARRACRP